MSTPNLRPCLRCGKTLCLHDNDWSDPSLWSWRCASCGLSGKEFVIQAEAVADANYRPLETQSGWRPIETAPAEEATPFLVLLPKNDVAPFVVLQVSWFEGRMYPDARDACIDWENGITTATHWMPAPKPGAST